VTLEDLHYISQVVSAVAILASLIFVGMQLKPVIKNVCAGTSTVRRWEPRCWQQRRTKEQP
jgi:uncharacterized protein YoxC